MNRFYTLLLTTALTCLAHSAVGQGQSASVRASIITNESGGRMSDILVFGGNRTTVLYKLNAQEIDPRQMPYSSIKVLQFHAPGDYMTAMEDFQNGRYKEAGAKFGDIKAKYRGMEGLPGNFSVKAAFMEAESALKLLDWPLLKDLASKLPKQNYLLQGSMENDAKVYDLLGKLADKNPKAVIDAGKAMIADKKRWNLQQLGRISYALGMAYADNKENELALNNLAMAMVADHGGDMEQVASAMLKSMEILSADKVVTDYVQNAPKELTTRVKSRSPQKVQELGSLVYMYKNILFPNRSLDSKYDAYLPFYLEIGERQKAQEEAKKEQEAAEKPAAAKTGK